MSDLALTVDSETPLDREAIERLHARAFGPGRFARTAFRIREQAEHALDLSFVARVGSLLVGSVRQTPARVGDTALLVLGPLTVEPAFEGKGIGGRLLARAADAGTSAGYALILLVGDEPYYSRHGFRRVPPGQIALPGPVDPMRLLARELRDGALAATRGSVRGG